jgi:hypothetical protein
MELEEREKAEKKKRGPKSTSVSYYGSSLSTISKKLAMEKNIKSCRVEFHLTNDSSSMFEV